MLNKIPKRLLIICVSMVLVFCAVGGTLALIFNGTPSVENTFEPVFVSCLVEEESDKSNVKIKNTGDINAFVRATFVVMWIDEDGAVYSKSPALGEDYSLTLGSPKWVKGSDGFYYFGSYIEADSYTDVFIDSISALRDGPAGYSLSVHVTATAIQAEPTNAVCEAWGVEILPNGNVSAP